VKTRPSFSVARKFSGHSDVITGIHFGMNMKNLISASADKTVGVWDCNTGQMVKQIPCMSAVTSMDINQGDTAIATGHKTGDVRIFSMSSFEKTHHLPNHHSSPITSINFTADMGKIVSTSTDGMIKVMDSRA